MKYFNNPFIPKFFKEVFTHIPTLALKSVDWRELLRDLGPMIRRIGQPHLEDDAFFSLKRLNIDSLELVREVDTESDPDPKFQGNKILEIYFSQLKNPKGLNLDLRPKHFSLKNEILRWAPNNVWLTFDDNFRLALIDLYKGFYYKREDLFDSSLKRIGLVENLNQSEADQLKNLFREHFGAGDQEEVEFKLKNFQNSFYELFKFFMEKKVQLNKDFIFLGAYLVTLFMHLEELGVSYNVKDVFTTVFPEK